ncbi:selenoprotein O-like [Sinocyclocheilus rhinocerous]|uniref:selenoprotein O-like n=1 Tax=Sinocyclocheilus rhinocerous TaxID=307959 RepID=UPI0007B79DD9|nr:PREDICTED: selenoprotein O-like [Sinocyclocheilus rhinocerous]
MVSHYFLFFSAVASTTCRDEQDFCESKSCNERDFEQNHFYTNVKTYGEIPLTLSHKLSDALPLDEVDGPVIRTVKGCVFSECQPTPLKEPLTLAAVSQDVLRNILDLNESVIQNEEFVLCVSGGKLFPGSIPLAHRYGGHQFGYWAGQLGDGRAHLLGEYTNRFHELFKAKLGFLGNQEEDSYVIAFLLKLMEDTGADFTMTFRQLSEVTLSQLQTGSFPPSMWALSDLLSHEYFRDWVQLYLKRLSRMKSDSDAARQHRMQGVNPRYVLRNWMAESAIRKAEKNDFSEVALLQKTLTEPFVEQEEAERAGYSSKPPSWTQQLRVSCSS